MEDGSKVKGRQEEGSGDGGGSSLKARGPYIAVVTNRTVNLVIRGVMLFSVGVFLALVLNLMQVQRDVTLFPPDVIGSLFSSAWWMPPCFGTASGTAAPPCVVGSDGIGGHLFFPLCTERTIQGLFGVTFRT